MSEKFTALLEKGRKQGLTAEEVQEMEKAMKGLVIIPVEVVKEVFKDLKFPPEVALLGLGWVIGRLVR